MKRPVFIAYLGGAGALVAVALAALGVGGPPAPKTVLLMSGHTFGLGEQQVYAIDRTADLTVRFRDATGTLRTKKYHHQLRNSVAFTIEGVSSGGHPVLAMVTANPVAASPSSPAAYPAAPAAPVSPPPSPELDEHGALAIAGDAADLAPASIILSAVTDDVLSGGRAWKSGGDIKLPYGTVSLAVVNTASPMPNDQTNSVVQIHSTGAVQFRGKLAVGGFGQASLRGAGSADGTSFVDTQHKLLLGLAVTSAVRGNALARNKHGSYDLKLQLAIKLVHYVPGIPPVPIGPGYILASGYVGSYASPDTGNYSTAPPNPIAVPAPTNTEYTGSPLPTYEPSALPEASLPPIPMPLPSDQPVASPPPGPTPTPTPTRY